MSVTLVPLGAPPPEALAHLVGRVAERFGRRGRRHGKGGDADADFAFFGVRRSCRCCWKWPPNAEKAPGRIALP
ncbi:MAG: hypothetical protein MUF34_36435 [Polyangiaceae bacterium]|nr:hypothetical protein [Polyangiaceae bacterium]